MDDTTPFLNEEQHSQISEIYLDDNNNFIHPTAVIEGNVLLGKNNYIGAFCYITGDTAIGDNNRFEAYCSVGTEPEHREYFGKENKGVVIGDNNTFREFVTINAGCEKPTILKNNIIMLKGSHIGHDSTINDNCTLTCNVIIAGHCLLGKYVNMGLGSVCHQFTRIGTGCMIGMGTIITKKTNPKCFGLYVGEPARCIKQNEHTKSKFTEEEVQMLIEEFEKMEL